MKHLRPLFAIVLTSCVTIPDVPPGKKCTIFAPDETTARCLCVDSQTGEEISRGPIQDCHLHVSTDPEYAEKLDQYVQDLIDLARRRCRR